MSDSIARGPRPDTQLELIRRLDRIRTAVLSSPTYGKGDNLTYRVRASDLQELLNPRTGASPGLD